MVQSFYKSVALITIVAIGIACTGCSKKEDELDVSGARSAVFTVDSIASDLLIAANRPGALLGIFLTEFLSRGTSLAVNSALDGIAADDALAAAHEGTQDEDFELLQAFADALQVDIPELLNRSPRREESLEKYVEALRNAGTRSQERFDELETAIDNLRDRKSEQRKVVSTLEREQREAIRDKDFSHAGEVQESLSEAQVKLSETDLDLKQTEDIHDTFEDLLDIYSERLLAIESNRQALIIGVKVVDVPGSEELDILDTPSRREQNDSLEMLLRWEE